MIDQITFGQAVSAALLFGSQSRGDSVAGSDTDVAVFARVASARELIDIKRNLISQCSEDPLVNFSLYSIETANVMAVQGSLYLWHLKLEGRPLLDRGFLGPLFDNLSPYTKFKAAEDLETFALVINDMQAALAAGSDTLQFETATAFSILRSLGMMLGALTGQFVFSRTGPIRYLEHMLRETFPFTETEIRNLLDARLSYSGKGQKHIDISISESRESARKLSLVLQLVREMVI